ncbi:MAG: hypothetical protein COT74_02045 [Bdellovibrionales bacterium CG10_big_fil_rev_8_21_14_0_10_45_34]|nr:MAG: hypothetical protein COT74_02045 [Bdellovibrionales bacterium CG10_big_fil_rev_8_21_14_0_10_45_34]
MKLLLIIIFSWFLLSHEVYGAACCGSAFAAPNLIAGDEKARFSSTMSQTNIAIDNVDSRGVWRTQDDHQQINTLQLSGAHIFADRWQAGVSVPVISRSYLGETYSGVGDTALNVGYEYLVDWDYNPYRPKGLAYLQVTLPTGKSRFESDIGGVDSRGNGFWAIGIGSLLTKTLGAWDAFVLIDLHRSFDKNIQNDSFQGTLKPGYGANWGGGFGYSVKDLRLGTSLTWFYEDPVQLERDTINPGSHERFANASITASFMADEEWSGTLTYTDQTWFGAPINTSLGRIVSFQLARSWLR